MPVLPINDIKNDVLNALESHNTILLTAPPGAGKSTCLPLWLLELEIFSDKIIYLLQPRRIAAKNIACYLAKQLGESVGQTVGYRLRNETKVSKSTRLFVITEGILTQIIQNNGELESCALVVFDEFHERSLHADLAFALTRDIQQGLREELKILLMSATLATNDIHKQLPEAIALHSEGRQFSVEINYQAPANARLWREHALQVIKSAANKHLGSILVFLPGVADIQYLVNGLTDVLPKSMLLCPLYGDLSLQQQQQALAPAPENYHKLVLATNIAETSLTIEGVDLVIDSGLENVAIYDAQTLATKLSQRAIAKASAVQRAGRAGRLTAGKCIRLYSNEDFNRRREHNTSEILQADLLPMLIEIARWGVSACGQLPMVEMPNDKQELLAWQELQQLGLVNTEHRLSERGKRVAQYAAHPRFANMVEHARDLSQQQNIENLVSLACIISALLEERDIFSREQSQFDADIAHRIIALLATPNHRRHQHIIKQAKRLYSQVEQTHVQESFCPDHARLPIKYCGVLLALAYPERLAKQRNALGEYLTVNGKGLYLDQQDALANQQYIVAASIYTRRERLCISSAAEVDMAVLLAWKIVQPVSKNRLHYSNKQNRILSTNEQGIGAIIIAERNATDIAPDLIADCWLDQIKKLGLSWLKFQHKDAELLSRWRWLNHTQAHLALADVRAPALFAQVDHWLGPFLGAIKTKAQLDKLNYSEILLAQLSYAQQQQLNKYAPSYFKGPTGRNCPIRYSEEQGPIVSLPMQELYGVSETPVVGDRQNGSEQPLVIEILSPAQRPIQVTQDLVSFWRGSYKEVQKEMKSRYPKHYWPDDPANAQATRKTKKHIKS